MKKDMENFKNLYHFIDIARANRKYPDNTANNLKSALKIFEKELNADESKSISMIESSIEEIFRDVAIANKDKSILSLNTYKARLLKVINDYKKYGADPAKIQKWNIKQKKSTPLLIKKDKTDKENINLSNSIYSPVDSAHKIEIVLESGTRAVLSIPRGLKKTDAETIKAVINSLTASN
jgi:hypothetical protein